MNWAVKYHLLVLIQKIQLWCERRLFLPSYQPISPFHVNFPSSKEVPWRWKLCVYTLKTEPLGITPHRKNIHVKYTFHLIKELVLLPYYIFISYWKKLLLETETISPLLYNYSYADGGDAGQNSLRKFQKACPSWTKVTKKLNAKNQATTADPTTTPTLKSVRAAGRTICWNSNTAQERDFLNITSIYTMMFPNPRPKVFKWKTFLLGNGLKIDSECSPLCHYPTQKNQNPAKEMGQHKILLPALLNICLKQDTRSKRWIKILIDM